MKSATDWFSEYAVCHQNPTNKLIHWFCVPIIAWSSLAMLWSVPVPEALAFSPYFNWSVVAIALSLVFYFMLSFKIGMIMILFAGLCYAINWWLAQTFTIPLWQIGLGAFVIAWVGQFIGHHIEGKKPSFFEDLQYLLVAPAWIMNFLFKVEK